MIEVIVNKSFHTVIKNLRIWYKINWFIESDIARYFDNINHQIFMIIIKKNDWLIMEIF